jgi:hypothetical protein
MKMPDHVNHQVTDAVTQVNVKVVAEAPAMAMGSLYQTASQSTGMMFTNAVNAQQQLNMVAQAATMQGVIQMYSIDTVSDAIAIARMLQASGDT